LEELMQFIFVVIERRNNIVSPGIVIEYIEFAACDLGDALAQFSY
jgi:hypothetical protein